MTSRSGMRARRAVVSPCSPLLLVAVVLAACGGGGTSPAARPPAGPAGDTPTAMAAPGEIVLLQPSPAMLGAPTRSFAWSQVEGPPVELRDASSPVAHFVMPAVGAETRLGFTLTVERASGEVLVERRSWACGRGSHDDRHPPPASPPQFAVFLATKDLATRADIYLARLDGSEVFRLNGALAPGGLVYAFAISPDRRHVAYLATEDAADVIELFVARTDGGGSTKASGPLVAGGDVVAFQWSPDGSRIAFWADAEQDGVQELFTVRPDGSDPVKASGPLVAGGAVFISPGIWSPDASRLAYPAVQYTSGVVELFTSLADGSDNVRVSGPQVAGGFFASFAWSPDGSRLAYKAAERTVGVLELFTVRPDGSDHAVASGPMVPNGSVLSDAVAWSPDGSRLAYRADALADGRFELFTVRPDGTEDTLVSGLPFSGDPDVYAFAWSPDGSRIGYAADQDTDGLPEIYTSGPDGAANAKVSGALGAGSSLDFFGWAWSPDGGRIAYLAQETAASPLELFTATGDGSGSAKVSGTMAPGGGVAQWQWSPDGSSIAYVADQVVNDRFELFTVAPGGGTSTRVSGISVFDGDVLFFLWSADGSRLVYRADQLVDDQLELFVAAPDGGAVNAAISGPLTAGGDVLGFATR